LKESQPLSFLRIDCQKEKRGFCTYNSKVRLRAL